MQAQYRRRSLAGIPAPIPPPSSPLKGLTRRGASSCYGERQSRGHRDDFALRGLAIIASGDLGASPGTEVAVVLNVSGWFRRRPREPIAAA
jgi:hypothetical protein